MSLMNCKFGPEYDLVLRFWGEGTVSDKNSASSLEKVMDEFREEKDRDPADISLVIDDCRGYGCDYGYTDIDPEFLERLTVLRELVIPPSVEGFEITPAVERLLTENNVLVRGWFDTFAERLAAQYKLHFRPSDFRFGFSFYEAQQESTALTLVIRRDGSAFIKEEVNSPGSSAGNSFGGSFEFDLPADFYKTMTLEDIAGRFGGSLYESIIRKGKLKEFLEKANSHNIFMGQN